jgi:hypothetical protein
MPKVTKINEQSAATTLAGSMVPSLEGDQLPFGKQNKENFKSFHTIREEFKVKNRLSNLWN